MKLKIKSPTWVQQAKHVATYFCCRCNEQQIYTWSIWWCCSIRCKCHI